MTHAAIFAIAVVLPLLGAPGAQAARSEFFGITQGFLDAQDRQQLELTKVRTARFLLKWRTLEPTRGTYDWAQRDHFIGALASRGIRTAPFLWGSPEWVGAGRLAQPPISDLDKQAWRQFVQAAVSRYGPGGTYWTDIFPQQFPGATPLPITSWQVWNEPNLVNYFTASPKVSSYAELLRISDDAIKTADPHAQVVLAGLPGFAATTGPTAWQFLRQLLNQPGVNGAFDVVALHPYSRDVGELGRQIQKVRTVMADNGDGAKPLWLTELGWGSEPPDQFELNKGIQGQKRLLDQSFAYLLRVQEQWRLDRVYWFEWRDPPPSAHVPCGFCSSAGLLRDDRQPKPAYHAFTSFSLGAAS